MRNVKASLAKPGMGVTYGFGKWHAHMVVLGEGSVDFVATQWVNGHAKEDCQEVEISGGLGIVLDLDIEGESEIVSMRDEFRQRKTGNMSRES